MTGTIAGFTSTGIDDNATSTAITIDASENVGIGVTPESWYSQFKALQLGEGGSIWGRTGGGANPAQVYVAANTYYNTSGSERYITTNAASQYSQTAGTHNFSVAPSGTADAAISFTTAMTIANGGDVTVNTGNLVIGTSGKGIDFSATSDGSGTMTSEVLDDYEQGTFTPYWNAGSQTNASYSVQAGNYTKIGNRVHVQGRIVVTSLGSLSGGLRLYGLPFTTLGSYSSISIGRATGLAIPANATISGFSELGATFCDMTIWETSVGTNTMLASDLSADGDIMFALDYLST